MRNRFAHIVKQATLACIALLAMAASAAAVEDAVDTAWRQKLREFKASLSTELPPASVTARQLIEQAGFASVTRQTALPMTAAMTVAPAMTDPVTAKLMDMRLALALVSQMYGAKDNYDVLYAQKNPSYQALVFESGEVTVDAIFKELAAQGLQTDGGDGRGMLRVPVIIWGKASLRMTPGEKLLLSRDDGVFLMNFGPADLDGVEIRAVGNVNPGAPDFVPFFTNAGGAAIKVRNSEFVGLGFGGEMKFSGFSLVRNPMLVRKDEVIIENNTFIDIVSIAIGMADNALIRNNRIHDNRGASMIVTHSSNVHIVGNLISGKAPTNAIRLLQGSTRAVIEGNVILGGDRAGIAVRNDSDRVAIRNNVVWDRGGAGISASNFECGVIDGNLVIDSRQKGIEVRTARKVVVRNNTVIANRSAGIWVTAQIKDEPTLLENNVLIANGSGIASTTGERLVLTGNDFTRQFPQFVSGDLARLGRNVAENLVGQTTMVLTGAGMVDIPMPDMACPN